MKTGTLIVIATLLALSGTAVLAQCPPPCPPKTECPPPCTPAQASPPTCPQVSVCPPPCPQPCCPPARLCPPPPQCPCPDAKPGAIGAGPCEALADLQCQDFDRTYMQKMYQLNTAIISLTTEGIQRAVDRGLRDLSGEIRTRRTRENMKIAEYHVMMSQTAIPVNFQQIQTLIDSLQEPLSTCFDIAYAKTLMSLLQQAREANILAAQRSTIDDLRNTAARAASSESDEISRLQRWLQRRAPVT
jgi:uncharacterized protein (DUF305 family)